MNVRPIFASKQNCKYAKGRGMKPGTEMFEQFVSVVSGRYMCDRGLVGARTQPEPWASYSALKLLIDLALMCSSIV